MLNTVAAGIGGLGLFFAGMYLLTENLKKLTGRRFRATVAAWTQNWAAGLVWGLAAGAVMQSTTAVTFIVASMIASGLLTVRGALPIIMGCNVGSTALVIIASLDIGPFVLLTLGIAGMSLASGRLSDTRALALTVFGIGLVFLGLETLQRGLAPLAREPWMEGAIAFAGSSYLLLLVVAIALTVVTQATNTVTLLAIALFNAGVLSFEQTAMAIYGSNIGASVLSFVMSSGLKGRQRQVAMYQVFFKFVAGAFMVPLLYVEAYSGVPIVRAMVSAVTSDPALQLAFVHLVFNVAGALILLPVVGPTARLLARQFPPPAEEDDGRPQYLYDQAVLDPETALDLVALEQQRLASYMTRLLDIARETPADAVARIARQQRTFSALSSIVDEFLVRLGEGPISHSGYERLNGAINVQRVLEGLNETLADLARAGVQVGSPSPSGKLMGSIIEGIDALLLTVVEAMGHNGEEDRLLLRQMGGDRGALMQRLRKTYLAADQSLSAGDKMSILTVTNLTERASWLLAGLVAALPVPSIEPGRQPVS